MAYGKYPWVAFPPLPRLVCVCGAFNFCFSLFSLWFSNFPNTFLKGFIQCLSPWSCLFWQLLWHLWRSPWRKRWLSQEITCLLSLSGTTAAWLCQPQTFSSNCSFPISLPSNFPFESCSSWCSGISQLWWYSSPSMAPILACFAGVLPAGTCNLWDGLTCVPVELVALLTLVLAGREVVSWMKAPACCELGVTAGARILRRRQGPDYQEQSTRARLFL